MENTWREAIIRVLKESETAMHYSDIAEQILTNGYYESGGATPAATVNSQIATSIKTEGDKSPFIKVSPGVFTLRENPLPVMYAQSPTAMEPAESKIESNINGKFINAFGMYWQRELVFWKNKPNLYGKSPGASVSINFADQRGVYILYDHHTPIYVGRSTEQTIGQRLFQHTLGRIAGRWNRFSWFGTLVPTNDGTLKESNFTVSEATITSAFEALLIEALEPPQNRKQGDGFAGSEYVQEQDPKNKKKQIATMLHEIEHKFYDE
jgi:hypothetical protein